MVHIGIIGGGPGGYEAALVATEHGAQVTLIEALGAGGACVLDDCVPSKTLIASAETMARLAHVGDLGIEAQKPPVLELSAVNDRVRRLATAQSNDIASRLVREGVELITGRARLSGPRTITVEGGKTLTPDLILLATGASPRVLPGAEPDGERILNWRQLYDLDQLPEHLIVVGSGVTGAEFAAAYLGLGARVTLISSREHVLPGEDPDAAKMLEAELLDRGMTILSQSRADTVHRDGDTVTVTCTDGRSVTGSHVLMTVGSVPNTADLGLEQAGVTLDERGFITVDKVSRTSAMGIYAAGDCTGVLPLASVAAMQGRIAMWHALGSAVEPLRLETVAANVFTDPEIATVGCTQSMVDDGQIPAETVMFGLASNPRAKMLGQRVGFVKLFCRPATRIVIGGVVIGARASELILPISIAVRNQLSVDHLANSFTIYPSVSGSITEAARQLMR